MAHNLADLPPELLSQLAGKAAVSDDRIVGLFGDRALTIDHVLIAMYRTYGMVMTRKFITGKLYRLSIDGRITKVAGAKGLYMAATGETS